MLTALRQELQDDLEAAKREIEQKVCSVVTDLHGQLASVEKTLQSLQTAGQSVMENVDAEKGEMTTKLYSIIADASSEFEKHKGAINQIAEDVQSTKKDIIGLTTGLRL